MAGNATPSGCGTCSYCDPAPSDITHFRRWALQWCEQATETESSMSTPIAPVLFTALREEASPFDEPSLECFNAGAPAEGIDALHAPYTPSRFTPVAGALIALSTLVLAVAACILIGNLVTRHPDPFLSLEWTYPVTLPAAALFVVALAWASYLLSDRHPRAKAWQSALGEAWLTQGGQVFNLNRLPHPDRREVTGYAEALEEIRKGLNKLAPEGDELDGARYALERFIDVSDIPLLGKRAAEATHIKDPAVRQAAKEYKLALQQQEFARKAVESEIAGANDLLAARRQARTDAEIIRLVHER